MTFFEFLNNLFFFVSFQKNYKFYYRFYVVKNVNQCYFIYNMIRKLSYNQIIKHKKKKRKDSNNSTLKKLLSPFFNRIILIL